MKYIIVEEEGLSEEIKWKLPCKGRKKSMIEQSSQEFLKDYLSLPPASATTITYESTPPPPPNSWLGGTTGKGWRALGHGAKAETIHFIKCRTLPRLQLHMVIFENTAGQYCELMCHIAQDEHGFWHMLGTSGDSIPPVRSATRRCPWVRMLGVNGQRWLWAGGYITDKASDVHLVRLISKDGYVVEDIVEHECVLFQTDHPVEEPLRLEAYTDTGILLGVQTVFDYGEHERTYDTDPSPA